jgi:hypothetical protein
MPCIWKCKVSKGKKLNIYKNQSAKIDEDKDAEELALNKLITSKNKDDSKNWMEGAYVVTEGYLISFEEEGGESCNCGLADAQDKTGDVHIYVGLVKNAPKSKCIIVEITPAYKKLHSDYETSLEKNRKIRITGYLLYDYKHAANAGTVCKVCTNVWRKTCWEIHPVTEIEFVD